MSPNQASPTRVAIVGGGIAGLTAALRLAERGYDVTIYEEDRVLGGNLSSHEIEGIAHDVYPHMFCDWYENFWQIAEVDLGLARKEHFEPRMCVKTLQKGGRYFALTNGSTPAYTWQNLTSGFQPFPDMFVYAYSMIDLACQDFDTDELLSRYSVNGFLQSRPYITERAAQLQDVLINEVWSVHSENTSASSYKDFVRMGLGEDKPFLWLLKGPLAEKLIDPLANKLTDLGCKIEKRHAVRKVSVRENDVRLCVKRVGEKEYQNEDFDHVILAVPPSVLARLVGAAEEPGQRIVDKRTDLSELRRLHAEPIPVANLYFKKKIEGLPKENVGLRGSTHALSFIDLSQIWDRLRQEGKTVLSLAASDYYSLPNEEAHEYAFAMIKELHEYLPDFNPGTKWGDDDPGCDIDWDKSHFHTNTRHRLFVNEVGSKQWRPQTSYEELPRVLFAGDACLTPVDMATIEAAVMSGLAAARALWRREPRGEEIELIVKKHYSDSVLLAMKLALSPYAYGSKLWSIAIDVLGNDENARSPRHLVNDAANVASASFSFAADWWATAARFWGSTLLDRRR